MRRDAFWMSVRATRQMFDSEVGLNEHVNHPVIHDSYKQPVDLKLAQTYIPAFSCIVRATLLISLLSQQWGVESIPLQIVLGIVLYVERVIRNESIFDSNAILCSVLASHSVNLFRASPEKHHLIFSVTLEATKEIHADFVGQTAHIIYWLISLCLLLGHDIVTAFVCRCLFTNNHPMQMSVAKPLTIMVHGVLMGAIIQTPLDKSALSPHNIVIRSVAFTLLCIVWSYVCGVPEMVQLLTNTTRMPALSTAFSKGGRKSQVINTIVQSFIPCQLRFTVILFSDEIYFYCTTISMTLVMVFLGYTFHKRETSGHIDSVHPEYCSQTLRQYAAHTDTSAPLFVTHETDLDPVQVRKGHEKPTCHFGF